MFSWFYICSEDPPLTRLCSSTSTRLPTLLCQRLHHPRLHSFSRLRFSTTQQRRTKHTKKKKSTSRQHNNGTSRTRSLEKAKQPESSKHNDPPIAAAIGAPIGTSQRRSYRGIIHRVLRPCSVDGCPIFTNLASSALLKSSGTSS